ncbi:CBS domain-containing protein [Candidatus Micrarchaeota archaeon]|nr:CBS domain-containing protein [Candidatus Micrarchaeota archaeon]
MGSDLRVGDIMTVAVVMVPLGKTALDVAKIMKKDHVGSVIIIDSEKHAHGIITERDLVRRVIARDVDPKSLKVEKIMSMPLKAVKPDSSIEDAAKAMKDNKVKRLAVVNQDNTLVGIVSEGDIMKIFPVVMELIEEKAALS